MSIVYITSHNENIYNVLSVPDPTLQKLVEKKGCIEEISVCSSSTIGSVLSSHESIPRVSDIREPAKFDYLKKKEPISFHRRPPPFKRADCSLKAKRLRVPKRKDVLPEQDEKLAFQPANVIKRNVENAKSMKPDHEAQLKWTRRTSNYVPIGAELSPTAIYSKMYGRLPKYFSGLNKAKLEDIRQKQIEKDRFQPKCRYVIRDRKERLMEGLKANWRELQANYATLPLLTDTVPKILRKSKIEKELAQLEKDIVMLERHHYIYVYQDEE